MEARLPYFEVRTPRRAARLRLQGSFVVVGRAEAIPIFHDDPSLSREHAALVVADGVVRVRDLGSKNHVFLNGKPLERYAEVPLRAGDTLKMGSTTLTLREGDGKSPEKPGEKVDPEDVAKTIVEGPPAEALIDGDGEPRSQGGAAEELADIPILDPGLEDSLDGTPTPDPDLAPEPEPELEG